VPRKEGVHIQRSKSVQIKINGRPEKKTKNKNFRAQKERGGSFSYAGRFTGRRSPMQVAMKLAAEGKHSDKKKGRTKMRVSGHSHVWPPSRGQRGERPDKCNVQRRYLFIRSVDKERGDPKCCPGGIGFVNCLQHGRQSWAHKPTARNGPRHMKSQGLLRLPGRNRSKKPWTECPASGIVQTTSQTLSTRKDQRG